LLLGITQSPIGADSATPSSIQELKGVARSEPVDRAPSEPFLNGLTRSREGCEEYQPLSHEPSSYQQHSGLRIEATGTFFHPRLPNPGKNPVNRRPEASR